MNNTFRILVLPLFCLVLSCKQESSQLDYKVVYKNDKDGNTLIGSKKGLIEYIRAGSSIKIGWGSKGKTRSIEHLSEPIWIAVLNESEVVAHLDAQVLSKTDWNNLSANYADSTLLNQEWRVVITTKGEFDAVWYDKYNGKLVRRVPQKHTMTWFAKGNTENNKPFFLNE